METLNQTEPTDQTKFNPWPTNEQNNLADCHFENDFSEENPMENGESNENGLVLPDSRKYLSSLESKLHKINDGMAKKDTQAKKMLKELANKRDALFVFNDNSNNKDPTILEGHESNDCENTNSISSTITGTHLYETMERKLFPHLHTTNPEESKKLLNHDMLNLAHRDNSGSQEQKPPENQIKDKKKDEEEQNLEC